MSTHMLDVGHALNSRVAVQIGEIASHSLLPIRSILESTHIPISVNGLCVITDVFPTSRLYDVEVKRCDEVKPWGWF